LPECCQTANTRLFIWAARRRIKYKAAMSAMIEILIGALSWLLTAGLIAGIAVFH
jgi:hypothetical protein